MEYVGPSDPYKRDFLGVEILKGIPFGTHISIKHDKSMRFEKGSLWIVYITYAAPVNGLYEPYQGSTGIEKFTLDNFQKAVSELEQQRHIKYDKYKVQKLFDEIQAHKHGPAMLHSDLVQ